MRAEIRKIAELDLGFIVMLDDLDRLDNTDRWSDPAGKIGRGFPRFRYLLCYDKAVLSENTSAGDLVDRWRLYLQNYYKFRFQASTSGSLVLRQRFRDAAAVIPRELMTDHRRLTLWKTWRGWRISMAALKTPKRGLDRFERAEVPLRRYARLRVFPGSVLPAAASHHKPGAVWLGGGIPVWTGRGGIRRWTYQW